jgi:hypothetical protein
MGSQGLVSSLSTPLPGSRISINTSGSSPVWLPTSQVSYHLQLKLRSLPYMTFRTQHGWLHVTALPGLLHLTLAHSAPAMLFLETAGTRLSQSLCPHCSSLGMPLPSSLWLIPVFPQSASPTDMSPSSSLLPRFFSQQHFLPPNVICQPNYFLFPLPTEHDLSEGVPAYHIILYRYLLNEC